MKLREFMQNFESEVSIESYKDALEATLISNESQQTGLDVNRDPDGWLVYVIDPKQGSLGRMTEDSVRALKDNKDSVFVVHNEDGEPLNDQEEADLARVSEMMKEEEIPFFLSMVEFKNWAKEQG